MLLHARARCARAVAFTASVYAATCSGSATSDGATSDGAASGNGLEAAADVSGPVMGCGCTLTAERKSELIALTKEWTLEEEAPGYMPPSASWPRKQPRHADAPRYRRALADCGGIDNPSCHEVAFTLATALLGGALFGHAEHQDDTEPTTVEKAEGVDILHGLAARGCAKGACGLGFCFLDGPGEFERDEKKAARLFERAALAGEPQAMCELATMFYLGDGVPEDAEFAMEWFGRSAQAGVPAAMYLYAEGLLESKPDAHAMQQAFMWLEEAGRRGHRGARSRIAAEALSDHDGGGRYGRAAGRRSSQWLV